MNISWAGAVSPSTKRGRSLRMAAGSAAAAAVNRDVVPSRAGKHAGSPSLELNSSDGQQIVKQEIGDAYMIGTIRTLRVDKGFGFIKGETGQEYFFHQSAIYGEGIADLREGDGVEFEVADSPKGPRAANVKRTTT